MIHFEAVDSSAATRCMTVVRVRPGQKLLVSHLCAEIVGLYTHWFGGKTVPCDLNHCKACDRNVPRLWKGFFPFQLVVDPSKCGLLCITPLAVRHLQEFQSEHNGYLGLRVEYSRKGTLINSPMACDVVGKAQPSREFTVERVEGIVRAIMGEKPYGKGVEFS